MLASSVVLLIAPPAAAVPDVTGPLTEAGYAVRPVTERSATPPTAVVLLADAVEDPLAVTRTYRFQQPPTVPILWLVSRGSADLAADALDAGADACLLRPAPGPLLVGQLRALVRARAATTSDELRDLTHRLQKLYEQTERDAELVRRLAGWEPKSLPDGGRWRFGVISAGGVDEVPLVFSHRVFHLLDVAGLGTVGGTIVAGAVARELARVVGRDDPASALTRLSHELRKSELPDSALISAAVVRVDTAFDTIRVATAGFPAPVLVKPDAPAEVWTGSGPFLGTTDSSYIAPHAELKPGEKLVVLGRGAADLRPDVRDIADRHRHLEAQPLADAIAAGLGVTGITLIVAERKAS